MYVWARTLKESGTLKAATQASTCLGGGRSTLSDTWVRGAPAQLLRVTHKNPYGRTRATGRAAWRTQVLPELGLWGWGPPPPSPLARCGTGPPALVPGIRASRVLSGGFGPPETVGSLTRHPMGGSGRVLPHLCTGASCTCGLSRFPGYMLPSVALAQERPSLLAAPCLGYRDHAGVSCWE